ESPAVARRALRAGRPFRLAGPDRRADRHGGAVCFQFHRKPLGTSRSRELGGPADHDLARRLSRLPDFPGSLVGRLDIPAEAIGVEERIRRTVLDDLLAEAAKSLAIGREPHG